NRFAVFATPRPRTPVEGPAGPSIDVTIDFTRPDGQRTRPLLVENKRLYVDEHYISVWSPVLRYKLNRLLILCLREMRPNSKVDLTGSRYYALSDRVKVLLLERLHGAPAPEVPFAIGPEIAEPPLDLEMFQRQSDLFFSAIRAKTGRVYHVNPYYMAAWSNVFQERVYCSSSSVEEIFCPCSHEELKAFLMAIHPPQLRLNEQNIGPVLMAACKMESPALLKKCAMMLLAQHTQMIAFRLELELQCWIDSRYYSTSPVCNPITAPAQMNEYTVVHRCKATSTCTSVTWMCPQCKTYSTDPNLLRHPQNPQQPSAR
ncbi:BTB/POZ domain protein, partial [Teladorsagia circumcincta]